MIEEIKKQNKLIAVYGRVSTSNQENEGTIETQLSAVNQFAEKSGFTIVQKYIDNGWSGDSLARPALDQMRGDAKKKIWDAVLIYDPDRLARRYSYQELVMDELKEAGVDVLFVTIPEAKNDEDKIMYGMRGLFSQYERMKIAERFRLGKVRKAREGHIIVSEAPYGYTFILKKGKRGDADFLQGHYVINEYEAQIVKNIFSWVDDEGLRLRGIVKKLQELGIPPRKSKRGVWNTSTLSTLLRNRTYIGEGHYGASYATVPVNPIKKEGYRKIKKTSRRMKPENEWIIIKTPKILDKDLFDRVGQKLKTNFLLSSRNTKNEYLLAGKIWCNCGKRRAGEGPQRGKHLYYRCTDRIKSFPLEHKCKEKGLNAKILDPLVWQGLVNLMSSPNLLVKQMESWFSSQNKGTSTSIINIKETKKEIVKLEDQVSRYAKAYGVGTINLDQLKEYTNPIKESISLFNNQITKAESESGQTYEALSPKLNEIENLAKASEGLRNLKFEAKKAIVRDIIDRVVGTRENLQVYGYIPIVSNINVFSFNRNCGVAKCREINAI